MNRNRSFLVSLLRLALPLLLFVAMLGFAGCTTAAPLPPATSTPATAQVATATPAPVESPATGAASAEATDTSAVDLLPPVLLTIPEIDMEVTVSPMTWRVVETDSVRTTTWVLPESGAGWHPNSAGAGDNGNVVISGHQLLGNAPFAPIALGDVEVGQEILLANADGEVFSYEVVEVTDPLPISTDLAAEQAIAEQYMAQTQTPTLTLISGWPDYSTTHRVIVIAQLVDTDR